ncbi:MAG: type IV secretory system conjugative DNA transfer family protein [Bacilli bacterium]|nr:type IV secretory system conjugative DNA transfer family protein [Bacilli bacterium]
MPFIYAVILFIVSLMLIFLYLVEPFITRQKIRNNNEHGSARWATKQEIEKDFKKEEVNNINESGFPVYYSKDNKQVWFDTNTPHWIYLGSTGSGKSVTAVIPQCSFIATAKTKKSVFITDPKGEIFQTTSKMFEEQGYKILTLDFRNPSLSNHLNILEPIIKEYELYTKNDKLAKECNNEKEKMKYQNESIEHLAECNQLISSLSTMIMEDKTAKEAFWNNSASDLLYGIISLFLEDYADGKIEREQITLSSIKKFQNSSMAGKNLKTLIKYVEGKSYGLKSKDKLIPIITTSENTYKSITSIFNERMTLFDDINVENITSDSDFEFDILGKQPTVLYCCIPDESKIYYALVSIVVSLIYKTLVLLCNSQPNKRLPYDLVFLLDEFANTPPLSDIETIVSVARSRGMYFQFFLQSFAQLDNLYGKEVSQIIQDNCGLAYLKTNTQETAEAISKRLGNKTIETTSLNYSLSFMNNNGSKGTSLIARNLMTADEIKQLHFKTIIFPTIGYPIFRDTVVYQKFSCYKKGMIDRKVRPLERLVNTYHTVEKLKFDEEEQPKQEQPKVNDETQKQRTELYNLINKVVEIFGKVDKEVEYVVDNGKVTAELYIAPPLSLSDITSLEENSEKYNFKYEAITEKQKIKKNGRNSLILISLLDEGEKIDEHRRNN